MAHSISSILLSSLLAFSVFTQVASFNIRRSTNRDHQRLGPRQAATPPPVQRPVALVEDVDPFIVQVDPKTGESLLRGEASLHILNSTNDHDIHIHLVYLADAWDNTGAMAVEVIDFGPDISNQIAANVSGASVRGVYPLANTTVANTDILDVATGQGLILETIRQQPVYSVGSGTYVNDDNSIMRALCAALNVPLTPEADKILNLGSQYALYWSARADITISHIIYTDLQGVSKAWLVIY